MARRITAFDDAQAIRQMKQAGRRTIAKEFCEAMTNAQHDYEASIRMERLFAPRKATVEGEKRLIFEDGSYCYFGKEGMLLLPERFA